MLINKHKQQLKKVMLMEHQELFGQQNSNKIKRASSFSWYKKIALLLPIPALVLLGVLFFKKPAEKNQPSTWLAQAQEIYEQDLVKQANSVLHQKYIMPMGIMGGGNEDGVQWQNPERIVEKWKSKDGFINENRENGELINKTIDLYDGQENIIKSYTFTNEPLPEGADVEPLTEENWCSHDFLTGSNTVYCHEQGADHAINNTDAINIENALNSTTPESRTEALHAILENNDVSDLGIIDGAQAFSVNNDGGVVEYYFDINNFTLKKWVIKQEAGQDFIVEFLTDEYLNTTLDQVPAFSERDKMTELPVCTDTQAEKDNEKIIREKILNLPTGCYRFKDNEMVASDEVDYTTECSDVQTCCVGDDCPEDAIKCSELEDCPSETKVGKTTGRSTGDDFAVVGL